MFIERQQHPTIEFDAQAGQESPTLVHYFSDRADPFKSVLPLLIEAAGQDQERVFVITSPLDQIIDETLRLYQHPDVIDQVLIDRKHQPFFAAVKAALVEVAAKIDRIHFAAIEDEEEDSD